MKAKHDQLYAYNAITGNWWDGTAFNDNMPKPLTAGEATVLEHTYENVAITKPIERGLLIRVTACKSKHD